MAPILVIPLVVVTILGITLVSSDTSQIVTEIIHDGFMFCTNDLCDVKTDQSDDGFGQEYFDVVDQLEDIPGFVEFVFAIIAAIWVELLRSIQVR